MTVADDPSEATDADDQTGASINMGARWLDVRLPVTLTPDPAQEMYAFSSPFSVFGCNPIIFTDNSGATLEVAGKVSVALADLQSLLPKSAQTALYIGKDNKIIFDINSLSDKYKSYEGVKLVNDLITSQNNYKYFVGDNPTVTDDKGNQRPDNNSPTSDYKSAIDNYSVTPYYPDDANAQYSPEEGFQGEVRMSEGEFVSYNGTTPITTPRGNILYHEFRENYLRTETNLPKQEGKAYAPNGGMYYSSGSGSTEGGAHEAARTGAKKFTKQLGRTSTGASGEPTGIKFIPTGKK